MFILLKMFRSSTFHKFRVCQKIQIRRNGYLIYRKGGYKTGWGGYGSNV